MSHFYTGDDKPASWGGGDDSHLKIQVITFWLDLPHPILRIPSEENEGLEDGIPIQPKMFFHVILLLTAAFWRGDEPIPRYLQRESWDGIIVWNDPFPTRAVDLFILKTPMN